MKKEEAINVLEQRCGYTRLEYATALRMSIDALRAQQTTLGGTYVSIEWFKAVQAELDALKAKRTAKLDRSRWEGCETCKGGRYRRGEYCPGCGRPLTEEAWAEMERRINGE